MSKYLIILLAVLLVSCGTVSLCPSYGTFNKSTEYGQKKQRKFHAKTRMAVPFRF